MKLSDDERELLMTEVAQALDQVRTPEMRVSLGELLTAVDLGEVPEELYDPLQNLLEIGLESGRIRNIHKAPGETAARRLFGRTPRGEALKTTAAEVNEALSALRGQKLQDLGITADAPGVYSLFLETEEGTVLVRLDRTGVSLRSVELG